MPFTYTFSDDEALALADMARDDSRFAEFVEAATANVSYDVSAMEIEEPCPPRLYELPSEAHEDEHGRYYVGRYGLLADLLKRMRTDDQGQV